VKRFDEFHGVTNAVKEIRIAESDVLGAGGHLVAEYLLAQRRGSRF